MVDSSLRVVEERVRAFTLPLQNVAQTHVVVVACPVAAVKGARAFESGSLNVALGPIISDTIIIASHTSRFAVFTTNVKSIVVSMSLRTTELPSQQFIVGYSATRNVVATVNRSRL